MIKEILVTVDIDETRAAMIENGELAEAVIERPVHQRLVGNIYRGRVQNVLPGMQAAFVDIGLERNAFLYVNDALPFEDETGGINARNTAINDILTRGQEVLVQITKEAIGAKGPRVTRHISLPGRFLVLLPTVGYVGVSRRIQDAGERQRLRGLAAKAKPANMGCIVRTVAAGASADDLRRDAGLLLRVWERVQARAQAGGAPVLLHRDLGLVNRVVRDWLDSNVTQLVIDSRIEYERICDVVEFGLPGIQAKIKLYTGTDQTLFDFYRVEPAIDKALRRRVWLKSGGYIVIDRTEALTVIDVNTGKFVGAHDLETTVLKTNVEAANEIARQLRLRDIGGITVIDFIDMETEGHGRQVLQALEAAFEPDRSRPQVLGITRLGLVEVTRKKSNESLGEVLTRPCHTCDGRGRVLSEETMMRRVRAEIRRILQTSASEAILMEASPAVAGLLIGPGGGSLHALEAELGKTIYVKGNTALSVEQFKLGLLGPRAEVEAKALPVRPGQRLELMIEEPHAGNPADGIARIEGYVIDVAGAGGLVGCAVPAEITRAFRTYAKARMRP